MTSSEEDMDNLNAFVNGKLIFMSEKGLEQRVGDESVNVEEILNGNLAAVSDHIVESEGTVRLDVGQGRTTSLCPDVTNGGNVDVVDRGFSPDVEVDQILREELGGPNVTSTPKRAAWPIYSKRGSSVLDKQEETLCKSVMFDVASGSGEVGGVGLSKGKATSTSEGVLESFVTSGGFSNLEDIARRQAVERFVGARMGDGGEAMVRVPPVHEMFGQEAAPKKRTRYYPSQSAKSLLK